MWYRAVGCSMILTLSLLAAPLLAVAQPAGQMRRIGLLTSGGALSIDFERYFEAFRQGLRDLGWVEGQNLTIAYRTAENHPERLPALAAELVGLPVEVIVTRWDSPPAPPRTRRARSPSSWAGTLIPCRPGSSPAWPGPAATSRG